MSELCRILDWDSDFFGIRIAEIGAPRMTEAQARQALDWCESQGVRCLYWLADPQDHPSCAVASDHRFCLVDVRMTYACQANAGRMASSLPPGMSFRVATADDGPQLAAIAEESHIDTRFCFDPQFNRERCGQLYRTWICNSISGFADVVYVLLVDKEIAGYVTCKKREVSGRIDLIAVKSSQRGRGVGRHLVDLARHYFAGSQVTRVEVSTSIRNLPAQRLYTSAGFLPADQRVWFHRWFDSSKVAPST